MKKIIARGSAAATALAVFVSGLATFTTNLREVDSFFKDHVLPLAETIFQDSADLKKSKKCEVADSGSQNLDDHINHVLNNPTARSAFNEVKEAGYDNFISAIIVQSGFGSGENAEGNKEALVKFLVCESYVRGVLYRELSD